MGFECSSVVEQLPDIHEALGSTSTKAKKKINNDCYLKVYTLINYQYYLILFSLGCKDVLISCFDKSILLNVNKQKRHCDACFIQGLCVGEFSVYDLCTLLFFFFFNSWSRRCMQPSFVILWPLHITSVVMTQEGLMPPEEFRFSNIPHTNPVLPCDHSISKFSSFPPGAQFSGIYVMMRNSSRSKVAPWSQFHLRAGYSLFIQSAVEICSRAHYSEVLQLFFFCSFLKNKSINKSQFSDSADPSSVMPTFRSILQSKCKTSLSHSYMVCSLLFHAVFLVVLRQMPESAFTSHRFTLNNHNVIFPGHQ